MIPPHIVLGIRKIRVKAWSETEIKEKTSYLLFKWGKIRYSQSAIKNILGMKDNPTAWIYCYTPY